MARQVVADAGSNLRLLHPFIPFITETIWQHLHEYTPVRGIQQAFPTSELLILAAWPQPDSAYQDEALEAEFDS